MIFTAPLPLASALAHLESLGLLPTHLASHEIRDHFAQAVLDRSLFSARTVKAQLLQGYRETLAEMLGGTTNIATARAKMQDLLDSMGYDAERGGFEDAPVEPAARGSLQDLASDERVDLVLRTNMAQVTGAAETARAMGDTSLYRFPAWELVRVESVLVPRGTRRGKDGALVADEGKGWPARWEQVGGEFYDGHMIARKDDPIWDEIGSSENFDDALDTSWPPYAFNSGFGRRQVPRRECIQLGLITEEDEAAPVSVRVNEGLQASVRGIPTADLAAVRAGLKAKLAGLKLTLDAEGFDLATGTQRKEAA